MLLPRLEHPRAGACDGTLAISAAAKPAAALAATVAVSLTAAAKPAAAVAAAIVVHLKASLHDSDRLRSVAR